MHLADCIVCMCAAPIDYCFGEKERRKRALTSVGPPTIAPKWTCGFGPLKVNPIPKPSPHEMRDGWSLIVGRDAALWCIL